MNLSKELWLPKPKNPPAARSRRRKQRNPAPGRVLFHHSFPRSAPGPPPKGPRHPLGSPALVQEVVHPFVKGPLELSQQQT